MMLWHLKQLLPLTYRSHYCTDDGCRHFAVWRMWFGKVFAHEDHVILYSHVILCSKKTI